MDLNTQLYINVPNLLTEIEELEKNIDVIQTKIIQMKTDRNHARHEGYDKVVQACESTLDDLRDDEEEQTEDVQKLILLRQDIEQYNSFSEAEVVNEDHFEAHMREQAMDIHGVDIDSFPFCYIDWDRARENLLEQDYSSIEFDGDTFYVKIT